MKMLALSWLFVALSTLTAHASGLTITCDSGEDTVKIQVDLAQTKHVVALEVYSQSGLGPNSLESSYVASKSAVSFMDNDSVTIRSVFPIVGEINLDLGQGKAVVVGKSKNLLDLTNCLYQ